MNKPILAVIRCSLMLLLPAVAYPNSTQWDLDPISGDWNTAANWTPMGVPNGPADIATFGLSNTTDVSISASTDVNAIVFTAAATNPYTITASPGLTLTISGVGIMNNSGITQNFVSGGPGSTSSYPSGLIQFTNSATAGNFTTFVNSGGTSGHANPGGTYFLDTSTAGSATISNNGGGLNASGGVTGFFDTSTAATSTINNNASTVNAGGGETQFFDSSSAGNATITNHGATVISAGPGFTVFFDSSSAGSARIINNGSGGGTSRYGYTEFVQDSTADNATITNNGGTVSGAIGSGTIFAYRSTAGNATITNNGGTVSGAGGARTTFVERSTAGDATITNNGGTVSGAAGASTSFINSSTAGSSTLVANGGSNGGEGGTIIFEDQSTVGTAQIEVFGNGSLDISRHAAPGMTINSIVGDGNVFLGANNLTVGSNNLSTTFSGVIQDTGSLTKIGTGTLDLTGANTYTGNTNVNRGVLQVDGSITSNTFVNHRGTLAGTGMVSGNVTNNDFGTVRPGGVLGAPGVLTVVGNYTQTQYATLMIQIAGTTAGDFSVLNVLGSANLSGYLDPVLLNGFVPTIGQTFTFLDYASLTGEFSHIKHRVFDNGLLQWSVIYEANHAILTVEQHTPDQGSTLLLLTVGLLGLVTYRRQLL
jgi:autotransporter-associated beta strand protein